MVLSKCEVVLLRGQRRTGIGGVTKIEDNAGRLSAERRFLDSVSCEMLEATGRRGKEGMVSDNGFRGLVILLGDADGELKDNLKGKVLHWH